MLGWLACFYKPLFQRRITSFRFCISAGPAGNGKSPDFLRWPGCFTTTRAEDRKPILDRVCALAFATGTDSIPMIVDEYKPNEMAQRVHDRLKLMFRDAYNAH